MIDNRFPWIVRIENAPIGDVDKKRLRKMCDNVSRRTGRKIGYNLRTRSLYVWQRSVDQGLGWPFEVVRKDNSVTIPDEDDVVRIIHLGQVPQDVKDKWAKQQKWLDDMDRQSEEDRHLDNIRPEALNSLKRRRERLGMHSKYRPSVLVNGLKE